MSMFWSSRDKVPDSEEHVAKSKITITKSAIAMLVLQFMITPFNKKNQYKSNNIIGELKKQVQN